MNKPKGLIFLAAASVFLVFGTLSVFASGQTEGASGGKVTITFNTQWKTGRDQESALALPMLKTWAQEHPNVHLSIVSVVGDEMRNVIRTDVAADNTPDVWQFWVGGVLTDYAKAGVLLDMNKFLAVSKEVKKSDMTDFAWKTATINGVLVGLPRTVALGSFFVNSAIFKKYGKSYPKTWAEFIADGKFFRAHGITPTNIGSKGGNPSHFWYNQLCDQWKSCWGASQALSKALNYQDPSFLKAAQYVDQMRKAGMFPKDVVANGDWAPSMALYNQGNVAMGYTYPWMYSGMPAKIVAESVIIPVPQIPGTNVSTKTFTGGTVNDAYVASAKAWKNPAKQAAMTSLLNLVDKKIGFALAQAGLLVTPDNSVMAKVDISKITLPMSVKAIKYQQETKESGSPMIWQLMPDNKTQFDYQADLDKLWAGSITPEQYVKEVQQSLDTYKANH